MNANKETAAAQVEDAIEMLDRVITRIDNGDIGFSEAGDWLHNCGDTIVSALKSALPFVKGGAE